MPTVKTLLPQTQTEAKLLRVAAYCRVSSDSTDQEHSFAAQVKYYTEMIGKNPAWTLADIYSDEGISGTSTGKREDFNRLIADCKRGKIDRVLTKSVSRFARNTVDCLNTVRLLSSLGVSILFEKEQIDTCKMSSEILLAMTGTQAQDESISISGNMRWSYEKRMKSGRYICCRTPYGYDFADGTLSINEKEAKIVRDIFRMFLSGTGKQKIATILNEQQVPRRYGKDKWYHFTIDYILRNERYMGDALLQKSYTTDTFPYKKVKNHGERSMYYVENSHPPIISKEDFETARAILEKRKHKSHRKKTVYPLTKLLVCAECGHPYRRVSNNGTVPYWICAYRMGGKTECQSIRLDEEDIYAALLRMVNILQSHCDDILKPMITALEQAQSRANGTQHKVYEIDKEIAALNSKTLAIAKLQTQGILDPADFASQISDLSHKVTRLRSERTKLLRMNEADDDLIRLKAAVDTLAGLESEVTEYDENLIRSFVEKITVKSETEIEIRLFGGLTLTEHLPCRKRRCKRK